MGEGDHRSKTPVDGLARIAGLLRSYCRTRKVVKPNGVPGHAAGCLATRRRDQECTNSTRQSNAAAKTQTHPSPVPYSCGGSFSALFPYCCSRSLSREYRVPEAWVMTKKTNEQLCTTTNYMRTSKVLRILAEDFLRRPPPLTPDVVRCFGERPSLFMQPIVEVKPVSSSPSLIRADTIGIFWADFAMSRGRVGF